MSPGDGFITISGSALVSLISVGIALVLAVFTGVWALVRAAGGISYQQGRMVERMGQLENGQVMAREDLKSHRQEAHAATVESQRRQERLEDNMVRWMNQLEAQVQQQRGHHQGGD